MKKRKRFIFIAILLLLVIVGVYLFMPLSCPVGVYQYFRDGSDECGYLVISDTGASYFFWNTSLDKMILYKHTIEKKSRYSFVDKNDASDGLPFSAFTWGLFMRCNPPYIMRRVIIKSPQLAYIVKKVNDGEVYWNFPWGSDIDIQYGSILSDEQFEMTDQPQSTGQASAELERAIKMLDVLWHSEPMRNMEIPQITLSLPELSYSDNQALLRIAQSCYPEVSWSLPDDLATSMRIYSSELRFCKIRESKRDTICIFDNSAFCMPDKAPTGYAFYYHDEHYNNSYRIIFEFNKNNEIISDNNVIPLISPEASE